MSTTGTTSKSSMMTTTTTTTTMVQSDTTDQRGQSPLQRPPPRQQQQQYQRQQQRTTTTTKYLVISKSDTTTIYLTVMFIALIVGSYQIMLGEQLMNPFPLNTTTTSSTTLTDTLKVTSLRSASSSDRSRSIQSKQEFSRRQSQLFAQSMKQLKSGRNMAMFMKDGTWLVEDLDATQLPRCGRFKCWVESKHHPGYGYTISQHFRNLKKDKKEHSKYDRHVMLSTYGFVKQLSNTNGFEHVHHTYPIHVPPKNMSPNDELFNFMTQQMTHAKELVEQYETTHRKEKQTNTKKKKQKKKTDTDTTSIVDDVVTEDDGDGDDDDDDADDDEGEGLNTNNKSDDTDSDNGNGNDGDDIPELVREKRRIKGYLPTKPWLVQPLLSLPNPESSFTFRYLDQLQRQNLALQTENGINWIRSKVLGRGGGAAGGDSDAGDGPAVADDGDETSEQQRLFDFSTMLQSQTILTLKLLWEVEPRLNADFQIWITKTGEIWHYDLDRIFGSSPRQIEETSSNQPSIELVKFIKSILREIDVVETPILDDYYNKNIQSALVWNITAGEAASAR